MTITSRSARRSAGTSAIAATGLLGGFAAGHFTGRRDLAGAVFGLAGAWAAREWQRSIGTSAAVGLTAGYVAAMGVSHPLAKRTTPWTSVALVTGVFVVAAETVRRR